MAHLKCFFCNNKATSLAYYSKDYIMQGTRTIENPTLVCDTCFDSSRIMNQISPMRGGIEGIYRFKFESIGKWSKKQLACHLASKGWEINHLATKPMRKLMWHIHYKYKPKGKKDVTVCQKIS